MALRPTLFLIAFLIPTVSNFDFASVPDQPSNCWVRCTNTSSDSLDAIREGDPDDIRCLLFPGGITVASPDGSIPHESISQAIAGWNKCLVTHLFRQPKYGEMPAVIVRKVGTINRDDDLQGEIDVQKSEDGRLKAVVSISCQDEGKSLSNVAVGAILTHELGHLLGLGDAPANAPDGSCVMGEFDANHLVLKPSEAEAQTVIQMRVKMREALSKITSISK